MCHLLVWMTLWVAVAGLAKYLKGWPFWPLAVVGFLLPLLIVVAILAVFAMIIYLIPAAVSGDSG